MPHHKKVTHLIIYKTIKPLFIPLFIFCLFFYNPINAAAIDQSSREKVVDVFFLNTQTNSSKVEEANEANIIKTKDDKYILIDTGNKDSKELNAIYKTLKAWQKNETVTIDYLIISHMHSDHYGNAVDIINNKKFIVKNLIIKWGQEENGKKVFDEIIRAARNNNIKIYSNAKTHKVDNVEVQNSKKYVNIVTEGTGKAIIPVGNFLRLYLYNTINVHKDSECVSGYPLSWYLKGNKNISTINKQYLEFDNSNLAYPTVNYDIVDKTKGAGNSFANYYYVGFVSQRSSCRDNANSYGILAEVATGVGNRYIYFANDLENQGFDIKPTATNIEYYSTSQGKNVVKNQEVYGRTYGKLYQKKDFNLVKNGTVLNKNTAYSESKVALEIADKLGANLSNLIIYQQSHHGINNAPDALATLQLNRPEVYAIANRKDIPNYSNNYSFEYHRSLYYLQNTKRINNKDAMIVTGKGKNGVFCAIDSLGDYLCDYDIIDVRKVVFNTSDNSKSSMAQTKLNKVDEDITIPIPSTIPSRNGYTFLGWTKDKNATTASYLPNDQIKISNKVTEVNLYAVWKQSSSNGQPNSDDPSHDSQASPIDVNNNDNHNTNTNTNTNDNGNANADTDIHNDIDSNNSQENNSQESNNNSKRTQDICSIENAPQIVKDAAGCKKEKNLETISKNITTAIISIMGLVAVAFIVLGGYNYMTSFGDPEKLAKAKKTILYAVIGLIICALAFAIANWVIDIINKSNNG